MLTRLQQWWAKRLAISALCNHIIECGNEWSEHKHLYVWTYKHNNLTIELWHTYMSDFSPKSVIVNGVTMHRGPMRKIAKALKHRGNGLKVYRDIVQALKPKNTPLQIEDATLGD